MPNRIIKEGITTSCEVDNLTAEEERLFYRMIVVCDDYGRMDARTPIIRAKCFPLKLDKIKDKDIEKWIRALIVQNLITLYEVEGKPYIQMTTWEKHQQRRAKYSKFPAPDDGMISDDIKCNHMQPNVPEESRSRGIENREYDADFEKFWEHYPRRVEKMAAYEKWAARLKEGHTAEELITSAKHYKVACEGQEKRFIKHGKTFLSDKKPFKDFLEPPEEEDVPDCWRIKPREEEAEEDKPYPGLEEAFQKTVDKLGG